MSESNYSFPPSSPLIGRSHEEGEYDYFAPRGGKMAKGMMEQRSREIYPTPNPSSTAGRSSSPARHSEYQEEKEREVFSLKKEENTNKVRLNRDFNILDPDADVLRVPLLNGKSNILIGRSSKSCDFFVPAKDKTVSRVHLSVSYNGKQIILNCLGYNGFAIKIPRPLMVFATNVENSYVMVENDNANPLNVNELDSLKIRSRSIRLDSNQTEFSVNRNESIILPRISNILIEIRDHLVLLNPEDGEEELTDEEMPVLIKNMVKPINHTKKFDFNTPTRHIYRSTPKAPIKLNIRGEDDESTPSKMEKTNSSNIENDIKELIENEIIPKESNSFSKLSSVAENKNSFRIYEDNLNVRFSETPQRSVTPLADKTNTYSIPNTPKINENGSLRKAQSEEPPKRKTEGFSIKKEASAKKKKKTSSVQPIERPEMLRIDKSLIDNIKNLPEINNIFINHLAFSRLSSTPASFLNTISALTSKLTLTQVRAVLHNVECIGVIYREGKDAAGKPLEEEYYYIPEKDTDGDRTKLVEGMRGHGGLRACRRTHKQYYWKKPAPIKK